MSHIKKSIWAIFICLGLIITFAIPANALDSGTIVIILQPAQGWAKINKVAGVTTSSINKVLGVSSSSVGKIGGISTH